MMAKKAPPTAKTTDAGSIERGLQAIAQAIDPISDRLIPAYHVEQIAESTGEIATSLNRLAHAKAAQIIAEHGTAEDREKIIAYLKGWFWESDMFKD